MLIDSSTTTLLLNDSKRTFLPNIVIIVLLVYCRAGIVGLTCLKVLYAILYHG